jgi:hypothetical protein
VPTGSEHVASAETVTQFWSALLEEKADVKSILLLILGPLSMALLAVLLSRLGARNAANWVAWTAVGLAAIGVALWGISILASLWG